MYLNLTLCPVASIFFPSQDICKFAKQNKCLQTPDSDVLLGRYASKQASSFPVEIFAEHTPSTAVRALDDKSNLCDARLNLCDAGPNTQIDSDNSKVLMPPLVCFAELLANVIVLLHCWVNVCKCLLYYGPGWISANRVFAGYTEVSPLDDENNISVLG